MPEDLNSNEIRIRNCCNRKQRLCILLQNFRMVL